MAQVQGEYGWALLPVWCEHWDYTPNEGTLNAHRNWQPNEIALVEMRPNNRTVRLVCDCEWHLTTNTRKIINWSEANGKIPSLRRISIALDHLLQPVVWYSKYTWNRCTARKKWDSLDGTILLYSPLKTNAFSSPSTIRWTSKWLISVQQQRSDAITMYLMEHSHLN